MLDVGHVHSWEVMVMKHHVDLRGKEFLLRGHLSSLFMFSNITTRMNCSSAARLSSHMFVIRGLFRKDVIEAASSLFIS